MLLHVTVGIQILLRISIPWIDLEFFPSFSIMDIAPVSSLAIESGASVPSLGCGIAESQIGKRSIL